MAVPTVSGPAPRALFAIITAAAIGCTPIIAAILASAPSAEVAR